MRADFAASSDGSTVAASAFGRLVEQRSSVRPETPQAWRERAFRIIGHSLASLPASTWLLVDLSVLSAGIYFGYSLFPTLAPEVTPHLAFWQAAAIFAFVALMASLVFGLCERETLLSRSRILTRMLLTTATATVLAYTIIYVIMYATVSRRVTGFAMSVFLVSGTTIRLCAWWALHKMQRGLLVVGSRPLFESFEQARAHGGLPEYKLAGYVTTDPDSVHPGNDPAYLGTIVGQVPNFRQAGITDIVVGANAARDPQVMDWVVPCLQGGCRVTNEAIFYEKATGQILVDEITPHWFLFADLKVYCDQQATLKRVFDVITTVIAFCLSAPLWPLIALAVKLCDHGPVFYSQDRVGQNGRVFKLFKFRTMRPDAENGKSVWSSPRDPRVTAVGRFLRRVRLDELPQLYNVLIGQMSIIGPRPERPDIVQELCETLPYYAERHLVKPGITGWAQISFRYGSSIEDAKRKLQFDLYYLKHMSPELDMIILLRTLGTFIRGAC